MQDFDASCFTGTYVTGDIDEAYLQVRVFVWGGVGLGKAHWRVWVC